MRHETWKDHLFPYDNSSPIVDHHALYQRVGDREAAYYYVVTPEAQESRHVQAFLLANGRRWLRAFIEKNEAEHESVGSIG